jgi:hypothetical protein
MKVTHMAEPLTEEHIQALLRLRTAEIRKARHPGIGSIVAGTLGAYSLARSDGLGGAQITGTCRLILRDRFLFCEKDGCDGILWRRDVVAHVYPSPTVQRDTEGRQFIACPECKSRNILAVKGNHILKVIEAIPPPEQRPLSSH